MSQKWPNSTANRQRAPTNFFGELLRFGVLGAVNVAQVWSEATANI